MSSHAGHAPTLVTFLKALKCRPLEASITLLVSMLKRRQIRGDACANATAHMLSQVVAQSTWHDVNQLLANVQRVGARLVDAAPKELVIGNIVRRVLGLIRDEASEDRNADDTASETTSESPPKDFPASPPSVARKSGPVRPVLLPSASSFHISKSMFNLFLGPDAVGSTTGSTSPVTGTSTPVFQVQPASPHALRSEVLDGIEEIMDEISQADDQIASFADVHINPADTVLVYQPTPTVERFLLRAAHKKRFTVFLVTSHPSNTPLETPFASLRKKLGAAGVTVINVASNGVSAYMPRVSKIILNASALVSDGGVLAAGGSTAVARVARQCSKTVIVLGGVFKLSPEDSADSEAWTEVGDPSGFVSYSDGPMLDVFVENVTTELITPELVDIYVTNLGTHTRNHLNGILVDHYKPEDTDFHLP